jgi:hypothetical protein
MPFSVDKNNTDATYRFTYQTNDEIEYSRFKNMLGSEKIYYRIKTNDIDTLVEVALKSKYELTGKDYVFDVEFILLNDENGYMSYESLNRV